MKITIAKKPFEILPGMAIHYFIYSVLGVLALLFLFDSVVITSLEDQWKMCSASWRADHTTLINEMKKRNQADEKNPIWRSAGFPIDVKCPKSKRIFVMGDSFVWGHGHANLNNIWWRQLQKELQRRGYNDVEVRGVGMVGAPTKKELKWAKELVPVYKPDAIIWGYVTNDPDEGDGESGKLGYVQDVQIPPDDFPGRTKTLICAIYPNLADELFFVLRNTNRANKITQEVLGHPGIDLAGWEMKILQGKNWQSYTHTVAQLGSYLQTIPQVASFAVTLPCCVYDNKPLGEHEHLSDKIREYYTTRYKPVAQLFNQNNIKWYDTLDHFLAMASQDKRMESRDPPLWLGVAPTDSHPGAMATHAYATKTADILEANYPQCLGKKSLPYDTADSAHINDWVPASIGLKQYGTHVVFGYPMCEPEMLTMPIRKPFVQLNLETPAPVSQITITGANLQSANVYFSSDDVDKHFDDGSLTELGRKRGKYLTWKLPVNKRSLRVNTLRICAEFKGQNHGLLMDIASNGAHSSNDKVVLTNVNSSH